MIENEALLRAAAAERIDGAARLIYADWLEERGDPRAEFIRLQVKIEHAAPHTDFYASIRAQLKPIRAKLDPTWLETMGYQLRHRPLFTVMPERRPDCWRLIEEFIEIWHRPLQPGDGFSEDELRAAEQRLGIKLPAALREWYLMSGRREDVWSRQDGLWSPDGLRIDPATNMLVIRTENQGCERWGIRMNDLVLDDPPVIEVDAAVKCSSKVSAFACLVLLYEAKFAAPEVVHAGGEITDAHLRAASVQGLYPCDLPSRYWVATPVRLYEGNDLLIEHECDSWVYVTARSEAVYRQLDERVRTQLEVFPY